MLENNTAQELYNFLSDLYIPDNPFETDSITAAADDFNSKYIETPNRKFKDMDDMQSDFSNIRFLEQKNAFKVGFEIAKTLYSRR